MEFYKYKIEIRMRKKRGTDVTNKPSLELRKVQREDREQYFRYLLLADESEEAVKAYMYDGEMFTIHFENKVIGTMLFTFHSKQVIELKNFALDPNYRGRGLGKLALLKALDFYKQKGMRKVIVGTANSSIGNLAFYQKVGFRMVEIKKDFFTNYPEPIFENGIRAMDMVMFEKHL